MKASEIKGIVQQAVDSWPSLDLTNRTAFASNMVWMYHVIKASENLLKVAIDHAEGPLRAYFIEHLEEERGHERWLAKDLAILGIDISLTQVARTAVELAGSQYYLIHHVDSSALLGYMLVLECFPIPLKSIDALEAVHGVEAVRTLRYHAEHDIDHGADVLEQIDKLQDWQKQLVLQNAMQSCVYIAAAIGAMA